MTATVEQSAALDRLRAVVPEDSPAGELPPPSVCPVCSAAVYVPEPCWIEPGPGVPLPEWVLVAGGPPMRALTRLDCPHRKRSR